MKRLNGFSIVSVFIMLSCLIFAGCYKRATAPNYSSDPSEVTKIREQLGAITADQEYINEEEEEDE